MYESEYIEKMYGTDYNDRIKDSSIFDKNQCNPVKKLYGLILKESFSIGAREIHLGLDKEEGMTINTYLNNGANFKIIPPPRYLYEMIGEEIGLSFGLIEERQKKQNWLERIIGKKAENERVLSFANISSINPTTTLIYEGKQITLKLMRGKFNDQIGYQIHVDYPEGFVAQRDAPIFSPDSAP